MAEIVAACVSQFHNDENRFELLLAYSDGREIGHSVSRSAAQCIAEELVNAVGSAYDAKDAEIARLKKENDEQFVVVSTDVTDQDGFNVEQRVAWKDIILSRAEKAEAHNERLTEALQAVASILPRYEMKGDTASDDEALSAVLETVTAALNGGSDAP